MLDKLVGKKFLSKVNSGNETSLSVVEVLAVIPGEFFNDDNFLKYLNDNVQSPGATINSTNNYLTFFVKEAETGRTFRVTEYECLYDISDFNEEELLNTIKRIEAEDRELKIKTEIGVLGLDKHFIKCLDVGLTKYDAF